jgi:hypothetical protein
MSMSTPKSAIPFFTAPLESNRDGDEQYSTDFSAATAGPNDPGSPIQSGEVKPNSDVLSHKEIRHRMLEMAKALVSRSHDLK